MTLLTEDEARQKWCPFARVQEQGAVTAGDLASNRGTRDPNPLYARCIASECMAWQWSMQGWVLHPQRDGAPIMKRDDGDPPRGFCGMAGGEKR